MAFDDWLRLGRKISRASSPSAWWLGRWLLYGERVHTRRYRAAIKRTALDHQTLRNCVGRANVRCVSPGETRRVSSITSRWRRGARPSRRSG